MKILGFDIGINSIGWAFIENDELKDCGVRIFTKAENPKTKESLALHRRNARSTRRILKRRKSRLTQCKYLISKEFNLNYEYYIANEGSLPKAYKGKLTSIYKLRYEALSKKLEARDLARVILHIAKHRGYMTKNQKNSNDNKDNKNKDNENKDNEKLLSALNNNISKLKEYQSVGEYLYKEFFQQKEGTKTFKKVRNKPKDYTNCFYASDLEQELKLILNKQKEFGYSYSDKFIEEIINVAFYQRPLKDFSHLVGTCTFFEDEKRAPKNSYSAWEFVALSKIINEIKSLEKISGEIISAQIAQIIEKSLNHILDKGYITYKKFREIINLDERIKFNGLKYDKDKAENEKLVDFKKLVEFKKALGVHSLKREELDQIATYITLIKDNDRLKEKLNEYKLSDEQINELLKIEFNSHINLSFKALYKILPHMREGKRYDEACEIESLKLRTPNQKQDFLPALCDSIYAQEISNPVVNRAISEYRKVLNALLKKYGTMHKIHIELSREIGLSKQERQKIEYEQKQNKLINDWALSECENMGLNPNNILKLKLWKEQNKCCIYSGKQITLEHLRDETALEVDHIYPYSRSYDNSYMNRVLVLTKENREKLNKTPFEAFGENKEKWKNI